MIKNFQPKTHNRLVASLVVVCFFLTSAFIAPPLGANTAEVKLEQALDVLNIKIDSRMARVQDAFKGSNNQTIILVQDAHAIPDAQKAIQKIIDYFQKQYGLKLVATEGAAGKIDGQIFKSFPDKTILERVFENYRSNGELTGTNAAAIFNTSASDYYGIENWVSYEQGYELYQKAMAQKEEIQAKLKIEKERVELEKKSAYSKDLYDLDQTLNSFNLNHTEFMQALEAVSKIKMPQPSSDLDLILKESQNQAGWQEFDSEIKIWANKIKTLLAKKDILDFNLHLQQFQTSQTSALDFAFCLQELTRQNSFSIQPSSKLSKAIQMQEQIQNIEGTKLLEDFESYAQEVKESLFRNDSELKLDQKAHLFDMLSKLSELELTQKDWIFLKETRLEAPWSSYFADHFNFYKNTLVRDEAFLKNLMELMKKNQTKLSLLVAGGFHAENLMQQFKEKNVSCVLLSPPIKNLPEKNHYAEHMKGEVSWKNYFQVENGRIDLYKPFVRAARDLLLKESKDPEILRNWRTRIMQNLAEREQIAKAQNYTQFIDEIALKNKDKFMPKWRIKVDEFLERLRGLDQAGQWNQQSIFNILRTPTMGDGITYASLVPQGDGLPELWSAFRPGSLVSSMGASNPRRPALSKRVFIDSLSRSEVRNVPATIAAEFEVGGEEDSLDLERKKRAIENLMNPYSDKQARFATIRDSSLWAPENIPVLFLAALQNDGPSAAALQVLQRLFNNPAFMGKFNAHFAHLDFLSSFGSEVLALQEEINRQYDPKDFSKKAVGHMPSADAFLNWILEQPLSENMLLSSVRALGWVGSDRSPPLAVEKVWALLPNKKDLILKEFQESLAHRVERFADAKDIQRLFELLNQTTTSSDLVHLSKAYSNLRNRFEFVFDPTERARLQEKMNLIRESVYSLAQNLPGFKDPPNDPAFEISFLLLASDMERVNLYDENVGEKVGENYYSRIQQSLEFFEEEIFPHKNQLDRESKIRFSSVRMRLHKFDPGRTFFKKEFMQILGLEEPEKREQKEKVLEILKKLDGKNGKDQQKLIGFKQDAENLQAQIAGGDKSPSTQKKLNRALIKLENQRRHIREISDSLYQIVDLAYNAHRLGIQPYLVAYLAVEKNKDAKVVKSLIRLLFGSTLNENSKKIVMRLFDRPYISRPNDRSEVYGVQYYGVLKFLASVIELLSIDSSGGDDRIYATIAENIQDERSVSLSEIMTRIKKAKFQAVESLLNINEGDLDRSVPVDEFPQEVLNALRWLSEHDKPVFRELLKIGLAKGSQAAEEYLESLDLNHPFVDIPGWLEGPDPITDIVEPAKNFDEMIRERLLEQFKFLKSAVKDFENKVSSQFGVRIDFNLVENDVEQSLEKVDKKLSELERANAATLTVLSSEVALIHDIQNNLKSIQNNLVELEPQQVTLAVSQDPIERLNLGVGFLSCLNCTDGGQRAEAFGPAVDLNTRVVFAKDVKGNRIGRLTLTIAGDTIFVSSKFYRSSNLNLTPLAKKFLEAYAVKTGKSVVLLKGAYDDKGVYRGLITRSEENGWGWPLEKDLTVEVQRAVAESVYWDVAGLVKYNRAAEVTESTKIQFAEYYLFNPQNDAGEPFATSPSRSEARFQKSFIDPREMARNVIHWAKGEPLNDRMALTVVAAVMVGLSFAEVNQAITDEVDGVLAKEYSKIQTDTINFGKALSSFTKNCLFVVNITEEDAENMQGNADEIIEALVEKTGKVFIASNPNILVDISYPVNLYSQIDLPAFNKDSGIKVEHMKGSIRVYSVHNPNPDFASTPAMSISYKPTVSKTLLTDQFENGQKPDYKQPELGSSFLAAAIAQEGLLLSENTEQILKGQGNIYRVPTPDDLQNFSFVLDVMEGYISAQRTSQAA